MDWCARTTYLATRPSECRLPPRIHRFWRPSPQPHHAVSTNRKTSSFHASVFPIRRLATKPPFAVGLESSTTSRRPTLWAELACKVNRRGLLRCPPRMVNCQRSTLAPARLAHWLQPLLAWSLLSTLN